MQKVSYQELINRDELQRLQNEFSTVAGVSLYCLDAGGEQITTLSGEESDSERLREYLAEGNVQGLLERVEEGSLEDLAVEELEGNGDHIAAIAVRVEETTVFYWVIYMSGDKKNAGQFYDILDLLRDSSYTLISNKVLWFSAEAESRRSRFAQQEMSRDLHTVEATTEIVQLLDSDWPIESIIDKWLGILGNYLKVDTAQVYQIHPGNTEMDILCEWKEQGQVPFFEKTKDLPVLDIPPSERKEHLSDGQSGDVPC